MLLFSGQLTKNRVLLVGSYLAALLALLWGIDGMWQHESRGLWQAITLGALMLLNTVLAHQHSVRIAAKSSTSAQPFRWRTEPAYFMTLCLASWFVATWNNAARPDVSVIVACEAAALILSVYALRIPEVTILSVGYLALGQVLWMCDVFLGELLMPWWNPLLMLSVTLGIYHWWQKQRVLDFSLATQPFWQPISKLPLPGKILVLFAASYFAAGLEGTSRFATNAQANFPLVYLAVALAALMLADALLLHRESPDSVNSELRPLPSYSTVLAFFVLALVTWHHTSRQFFPLVMAIEALGFTVAFYVVRMPELPLFGQGFLLAAQLFWVMYFGLDSHRLPAWWNPVLLIGISLGLAHWWQKQKVLTLTRQTSWTWQGLYSLAIVGVRKSLVGCTCEPPAVARSE